MRHLIRRLEALERFGAVRLAPVRAPSAAAPAALGPAERLAALVVLLTLFAAIFA